MNFIDAIEGTGCSILQRLHRGYFEGARDDSELIGNFKMVIEGVEAFVLAHTELVIPADVVVGVLYDHARQLWSEGCKAEEAEKKEGTKASEEEEAAAYRHYYFDHVYRHGVYPR